MPMTSDANIEITAFAWVPPFAQGLVRDLRIRWALEEIGLDYKVRLLGPQRPPEYLKEQPFDQVPTLREGDLQIFESGAILQYIGEKDERLLPRDPQQRYRAIQWTYAAVNSVEPAFATLFGVNVFYADQQWAKLRQPSAEEFARLKLKRVSDWLGDKEWLEDRFTIGDIMMVTVLRFLNHAGIVADFPDLAAYQQRSEARPAFQRALADQLDTFRANQPQGVAA